MNKKIFEKDLVDFCKKSLLSIGMGEKDAMTTALVLSETDAYGTHSHGTKNLYMYIEKVKAGTLDVTAKPEFIKQEGAIAVMDAKDSFGMVASVNGMNKAIALAKQSGIGFVTVKNSCHFGGAGYYANMAAKQGMVGIAMGNTDPNMVVPGGKGMIIGNSPFAYAVPAGKHNPIFLDIAMSATAALKINQAKIDKKSIPDTWLVDDEGMKTTDPNYYGNGGSLQPMAAHKGYGLSLLVDVLSGLLSGGAVTKDIPSWCFELDKKNIASHAFIAFNIEMFQSLGVFEKRADEYIDYVKDAPKAKRNTEIFMPGEIEWNRKQKADKEGIDLPCDVVQSLEKLSQRNGIDINWI